jgi:hypothetical protein
MTRCRLVRINRIDIQGFGPLTGSFCFPADGLGYWGAPNRAGKTALTAAAAAAFYGEADSRAPHSEGEAPWIVVRLTRDSGEPLVLGRNLATGVVQVADANGQDITTQFHNSNDAVEVGESLLGLTRSQFEEVGSVRLDDLRNTPGNRTLLALLKHGRGRPAVSPGGSITPAPTMSAAPPPGLDNDLQIVRSAAEELGYAPSAGFDALEPVSGPISFEDPDEPGLDAMTRVRRLHSGVHALEGTLEAKQNALSSHSMRLQEAQTEAERLKALSGAEPRDVEKLGSLVEMMKKVQEQREKLTADEAKLRDELSERQVPIDHVEELARTFSQLDEADRAFLDEYREAETVRRGTQALLRSESRLDETRIQEIGGSRAASARLALLPLCISVAGLAGWISTSFFTWNLLPPQVSIGLGIGGALVATLILWRARSLRQRDQHKLVQSLEGRHERLAEIDHAGADAAGRVAAVADRLHVERPTELLDQYEQWKMFHAEVERLADWRQQAAQIDREIVDIRQRLDSFHLAQDSATADAGPAEFEKLYRDYVLFFELHQERERHEVLDRSAGEAVAAETRRTGRPGHGRSRRHGLDADDLGAHGSHRATLPPRSPRGRSGRRTSAELQVRSEGAALRSGGARARTVRRRPRPTLPRAASRNRGNCLVVR